MPSICPPKLKWTNVPSCTGCPVRPKPRTALRLQNRSVMFKCELYFTEYFSSGLTCTEQNFITKAGSQLAAAEHGIIIVAPDTSPRMTAHTQSARLFLKSEFSGDWNLLLQVAATLRGKMRAGTLVPELVSMLTPRRSPGTATTACTPTSPRRYAGLTSHVYYYFNQGHSQLSFLSAPETHQCQLPH